MTAIGIGIGIPFGARSAVAEFAPTDLDGLVLWLRADMGVTVEGSGVSLWEDQSGGGNDASQSTDGNRPQLVASHANLNGEPAIRDTNGTAQAMAMSLDTVSQVDCTAFFAFDSDSAATVYSIYDATAGDRTIFAHRSGNNTQNVAYFNGAWQELDPAVTGPQVLCFRLEAGVGGEAWKETTSLGTGTFAAARRIAGGSIFAGNVGNFYLAEMAIYDRALSTAERLSVTGYMTARYGL